MLGRLDPYLKQRATYVPNLGTQPIHLLWYSSCWEIGVHTWSDRRKVQTSPNEQAVPAPPSLFHPGPNGNGITAILNPES
jgi:hypothetical protein